MKKQYKFYIESCTPIPHAPEGHPGRIITLWSYSNTEEDSINGRIDLHTETIEDTLPYLNESGTVTIGKHIYITINTEHSE